MCNKKQVEKYVGMVVTTNNFGDVVIIDYVNSENIVVKFVDTGYVTSARSNQIYSGGIKDFYKPTVYGVGIVGEKPDYNLRMSKTYKMWASMLRRCHNDAFKDKFKTYLDCTTSDNFKHFHYFREWCINQVGYNSLDDKGKVFQLDKDILSKVKGVKKYSEDTCCFVPQEINTLLCGADKMKDGVPAGICYHKSRSKYQAYYHNKDKKIYLGIYDTKEEAFCIYKKAKEDHIKEVANKWKDQIDPLVYKTLMNWCI